MMMYVQAPEVEPSWPLLHENGPSHNPGMICCAKRLFS
jgi:hypothetical protein